MINPAIIFSFTGVCISVGAVLVAIGVLKAKINQNAEANNAQSKQMEGLASKTELSAAVSRSESRGGEQLAQAIKRSDEMLELMRKRVDEDRAAGGGRYKELYGIINLHGERIGRLEVSQEQLFKTLDKLEASVTSGFREMKADMKELRDALKRG